MSLVLHLGSDKGRWLVNYKCLDAVFQAAIDLVATEQLFELLTPEQRASEEASEQLFDLLASMKDSEAEATKHILDVLAPEAKTGKEATKKEQGLKATKKKFKLDA